MEFQGKIMVGDGELIVTVDNQVYSVTREHPAYAKLFEAYKDNDANTFVGLVNVKDHMKTYVNSDITGIVVDGERVLYNGVELNNAVVDTIRNMMYAGLDFQPMVKFLERAIKSNSKRVIDELFKFLQECRLTVTEDGCFLAYKSVQSNYMDKYSGKFDNSVGSCHRMEKFQVDDNCNNACSHGFHVGALSYAGPGGFYNNAGDKVMIVKVAPEDVVSVPVDHTCQKLRTCAYEVVGEFKCELKPTVYSGKVGDDYNKSVEPKQPEYSIEPQDMIVDGLYRAWYLDRHGDSGWRYFVVLDDRKDHVIVELMEPEEDAGQTRRFNFDRFDEIYPWDGHTEYTEDEDDECDCCEECGECSDDCCCDEEDNDCGCYW